MYSLIAVCLMSGGGFVADASKEPPAKLELFAKEDWYMKVEAKEQSFEGTLEYKESPGIGFGRYNPYRLTMKNDTREVYVGGQGNLLKPYLGKKIRLIGKPVDMEVEGSKHREIWAARLEVIADEKPKNPPEKTGERKALKIHAQADWPQSKLELGEKPGEVVVIRDHKEMEKVLDKEALPRLLKALKVEKVDFEKQCLVVIGGGTRPSGGYTMEITKIEVEAEEKLVHVHATVTPPDGPAITVITRPARAALVDKFEGKVKGHVKDGRLGTEPPIKPIDDAPPAIQPLPPEKESAEVKVIAQAPLGGKISPPNFDDAPQQAVYRSKEELEKGLGGKEAVERFHKLLKLEPLDFDKHMVIHVTAGTKKSGGWRVEIAALERDAKSKTLTVSWVVHAPKDFATGAITNPGVAVVVEKFNGEVKFHAGEAQPKKPLQPNPIPMPIKQPPASVKNETADDKEKDQELKIHARSGFSYGRTGTVVVRSDKELEKVMGKEGAAAIAKMLKVEAIDFDKQMLVFVCGGEKPTGGYSVTIDKATLAADGKTLTIHWTLKSPAPGDIVTQAFTKPTGVALIDKFDGKIVYKPEPPFAGGKEE